MTTRPFRFGVSLLNVGSRSSWHDRVREAESLGYDVLQVPDHLGLAAPFPALVAAADVTSMRLGTYVLNAGILSPAYLARDVADVLPSHRRAPRAGARRRLRPGRVRSRRRALRNRRGAASAAGEDPDRDPGAARGGGRQAPAADHAVGLGRPHDPARRPRGRHLQLLHHGRARTAGPPRRTRWPVASRLLREAAGDRIDDVELNLFVAAVGASTDEVDLTIIRNASGLEDDQLVQLPGVLVGSPREIADRLLRYRETFGTSYISVLEPHMSAFAEVIKHLR